MSRVSLLLLWIVLTLGSACATPVQAAPAAPPGQTAAPAVPLPAVSTATSAAPYVGVWVDDSATLSDDTLQQAVAAAAAQQADPQHLVLMVHGFATPRAVSAKQYTELSTRLKAQYDKLGQRVAVVGLQWPSDVGPPKLWLIKVVEATLGFGDDNPYLRKVALARNVGVTAGRQLVLALHHKFPNAVIDVYAHSLGSDVTRNIIMWQVPEKAVKTKGMPEPTAVFAPDEPIQCNLVAMAGADIDANLLYENKPQVQKVGAARLFWLTVGGVRNPDKQDMVLTMRGLMRGRAMGNAIPHLHRSQINQMCALRRVVFDGEHIPENHAFMRYYDARRLADIVPAAVALADPNVHSPLLDTLDEIIKAPNDPKVLATYLDKGRLATTYYALWRLENLLCGQPVHLSDGYLQRVANLLYDDPKAIARERWAGPCMVVRQGYFPTPRMMTQALETAVPSTPGLPPGGFTMP